MNKLLYVLIGLVIIGLLVFRSASHNIPHINVKEFKEKMHTDNTLVLDVRTPTEIAKGKIEDAIEINFFARNFNDKIDSLDHDKTYLIYCSIGKRSLMAAQLMQKKGFTHLYNLDGGYKKWK